MKKRVLSLILAIMMLLSLFPTMALAAGDVTYTLASEFKIGQTYLIVNGNNGAAKALTNTKNDSFGTADVTVTDNKIIANDLSAAEWEARDSGSGTGLYNSTTVLKINAQNSSPKITTSGTSYNAGNFTYTGNSHVSYPYSNTPYYIGADTTNGFKASNSESGLGEVYIFVKGEGGSTGGQEEQTTTDFDWEAKPVSSGTADTKTDKIDVNGVYTIKVTNQSGSKYTYTASAEGEGNVKIDPASLELEGNASGYIEVTGLKDADEVITIQNNNSSANRKSTLNLKIGTGTPTTNYKLVSSLTNGKEYIIANVNSGSGYALANNNKSVSKVDISVKSGDVDGDGTADTYIASKDASVVMTAVADGDEFKLTNDGNSLYYSSGSSYNSGLRFSGSSSSPWTYADSQMVTGERYLYYSTSSNNFNASGSHSSDKVYIFEKVTAEGEGGSTEPEQPGTSTTYTLASEFKIGQTYLIVNGNNGAAKALTNTKNDSFGTADVTVTDNKIIANDLSAAEWEARDSGSGTGLYNSTTVLKINAQNSSPKITTSGTSYNAGNFTYTGNNHVSYPYSSTPYYIGADTTNGFKASNSESGLGEVYIFVKGEGGSEQGGGEELPVNGLYLAFTSDVHNDSDNSSAIRLDNWINTVTQKLGSKLTDFGFCGDLGPASGTFWTYAGKVIKVVEDSENVSGNGFFVCGNHEWSPGNFGSTTDSTKQKYKVNGEYVETDKYVLYSFGAMSSSYNHGNIDKLENYLKTAPTDRPIFILSHFPLHDYGYHAVNNEDSVIPILNEYGETHTIIFLWGHNHTEGDNHYNKFYTDSIDGKEINFTYASAGCLADDSYGSSGSVNNICLVAQVGDEAVTLAYYGTDGNVKGDPLTVELNAKDPSAKYYTITASASGNGSISPNGSVSVKEGSSKEFTFTPNGPSYKIGSVKVGSTDVTEQVSNNKYTISDVNADQSITVTFVEDPSYVGPDIELTPSTDKPSKDYKIAVGESFSVRITNGSENSAYDFTVSFSRDGVAQANPDSLNIAKGKTGDFEIKGLKDGTTTVTFSNGNNSGYGYGYGYDYGTSSYERIATINLTVGAGNISDTIADGDYIIVANGNALTAERGTGYSNSTDYTYSGLAGVAYDGTASVTDSMVWTIKKSGNGYTIMNADKYLNGTYTTKTDGAEGNLKLDETSDIWTYDGSVLTSTNSGKQLEYGNSGGTASTIFTMRSTGSTITLYKYTGTTPPPAQKTLSSIAITTAPTKTAYTVGESFDPTGMVVTATYSDESTEAVTGYTCAPSSALALTDTKITVTYQDKTAQQTITVSKKSAPAAPTGLVGVACTTASNNDGKITGVNNTMEYSKSGTSAWTAISGDSVTGLANGSYEVRVKETTDTEAGTAATVTVAAYQAPSTHDDKTFKYVSAESAVVADKQYLLVSNGYALVNANGTSVTAARVTVKENQIVLDANDANYSKMLWTAGTSTVSGYALTFKNGGDYIARATSTNNAVTVANRTANDKYSAWKYADDDLYHVNSSSQYTFYLTYSGSAFTVNVQQANSAELKLYVLEDGTQEPHEHSYIKEVVSEKYLKSAATCTEAAVYYKSCECGEASATATFTSGTAKGHTYAEAWSSDNDYHWHAATCGHDVVSGKADHSWNDGEVVISATETATGVKTYTCTVCGKTKMETIPVLEPQDTPLSRKRDFVERMYEVCLGRDASELNINESISELEAGKTGVEFAYKFIFSDEFKVKNYCDEHYVIALYEAFMGREPEEKEVAHWVYRLQQGDRREDVFNEFAVSPEFGRICKKAEIEQGTKISITGDGTKPGGYCTVDGCTAHESTVAFVTRLYEVCLDRTPEKKEIDAWHYNLVHGDYTATSASHYFIFSDEFKAKNYNSREFAKHLYDAMMGRNGRYTEDELEYWEWAMDTKKMTREQVFAQFASYDEFKVICQEYGVVCR